MAVPSTTLRVKVLRDGEVQVHDVHNITSFEGLEAWLIHHVDRNRAFNILSRQSGVRQAVTEETFDHLMRTAQPTFYVHLDGGNASPSRAGTAEAAIERELVGNLRFELEMHNEESVPEAVLSWDVPGDAKVATGIDGYTVTIIDECHGRQRQDHVLITKDVPLPTGGRKSCRFYIQEATPGSVCRAEVTAKVMRDDAEGAGEAGLPARPTHPRPSTVRFVQEAVLHPGTKEADEHWEACASALSSQVEKFYEQHGRAPRFLVLGKQHHGKSTLLNTLRRFIQRDTQLLDATRAAPAGDLETTMRTEPVDADLRFKEAESRRLRFLDVPAISNVDGARKKDVGVLLRSTPTNWGRGDGARPFMAQYEADGAILVVSLMCWPAEEKALKDYFKELTEVLKKKGCPYLVAATHRDQFLVDAGNRGEHPLNELELAVQALRRITNTTEVFAIGKIERGSCWNVKVDRHLGQLLAQLVHDARKRSSSGYKRVGCAGTALCVMGIAAFIMCHGL